jgi:hypothetical protein
LETKPVRSDWPHTRKELHPLRQSNFCLHFLQKAAWNKESQVINSRVCVGRYRSGGVGVRLMLIWIWGH